jgi:hypothetical protein
MWSLYIGRIAGQRRDWLQIRNFSETSVVMFHSGQRVTFVM